MRRIVIVGNGMAGSRLVAMLRARAPSADLAMTVFGAEPGRPYNRLLLSNVLAGVADPEQIGLLDPAWYRQNGVDARLGVEVTAIDRSRKIVRAADGGETAYDTLVLATGSAPIVPPLPGLRPMAPGVVAFRTVDDCRAILRGARRARTAVVVGGGLLGLEAARGLAGRGLAVTVVHLADHLMERQLDPEAGGVLARTLDRLGIQVRVATQLTGVLTETAAAQSPDAGGLEPAAGGPEPAAGEPEPAAGERVRGVQLAGGTVLDADLVVLACGIRPEVGLARAAGLTIERGVVVDDRLATLDDPDIHAIGECAQHRGTVYGLVAPAWEQAAVLADLLTGADGRARYTGSRQVTRLKAASVELAAMGDTAATDDDAEVVRFADPTRGTYKKIVVRDDRLVGAILLGETSTAGTLSQLYDRAAPLPADRLGLLFGGLAAGATTVASDPAGAPETATVCHCNNVTKAAVRACWDAGARTTGDIAEHTRATTGCGGCHADIGAILTWLGRRQTAPSPA
jgi:assimilatory nitrate reductase electron transfer subunit